MEEGSQRELQREQERERRRIRDRQRRQSMTHEERERHLARRRRNYQLRRQRAENARSSSSSHFQDSSLSLSTGLDVPAHRLAQFPSRLRLNHVKHLARSLDDRVSLPVNRIDVDLISRGDENADSTISGAHRRGMRLNRVKRIARSLNSGLERSNQEDHQIETEG